MPQGVTQISSPNNSVLVVGRTLVESVADLSAAYALSKQIQRLEEQLVSRDIVLFNDRPNPEFTIGRWLKQPSPAIGLGPVMAIEPIQRDAAPLQNSERRSADLPRVHDDGGTQFHLSDIAELHGIRESRDKQ